MIPLPFKVENRNRRQNVFRVFFCFCQSLVNGIATVAVLQLLPAPHMYNSLLLSSSVVKSTMIYTRSIYENTEYCPSQCISSLWNSTRIQDKLHTYTVGKNNRRLAKIAQEKTNGNSIKRKLIFCCFDLKEMIFFPKRRKERCVCPCHVLQGKSINILALSQCLLNRDLFLAADTSMYLHYISSMHLYCTYCKCMTSISYGMIEHIIFSDQKKLN